MISLFMFQSAWNVAAAFCGHEEHLDHGSHFGHHSILLSCQDEHDTHQPVESDTSLDATLNLQDHHDHLPSFSHILMIDARTELYQPQKINLDHQPLYSWINLYQSPDLAALTPPPLSTPLLVG